VLNNWIAKSKLACKSASRTGLCCKLSQQPDVKEAIQDAANNKARRVHAQRTIDSLEAGIVGVLAGESHAVTQAQLHLQVADER